MKSRKHKMTQHRYNIKTNRRIHHNSAKNNNHHNPEKKLKSKDSQQINLGPGSKEATARTHTNQ